MGLIVFHGIFLNILHIHIECECGILSVPQDIVMNLNDIMACGCYSYRVTVRPGPRVYLDVTS